MRHIYWGCCQNATATQGGWLHPSGRRDGECPLCAKLKYAAQQNGLYPMNLSALQRRRKVQSLAQAYVFNVFGSLAEAARG
jgi:hypothetical protein